MDPKCRHTCMHAPCIHTDLLPIVWHIHYMPLEGMKLCFLPWKKCPSPYVEKLPNFKGVIFGNGLKPCYHVLNNSIFWDTTSNDCWEALSKLGANILKAAGLDEKLESMNLGPGCGWQKLDQHMLGRNYPPRLARPQIALWDVVLFVCKVDLSTNIFVAGIYFQGCP